MQGAQRPHEAESEGWATRKIRGKIERSLRVGQPPVDSLEFASSPALPKQLLTYRQKYHCRIIRGQSL
jgi:hypothetical protein